MYPNRVTSEPELPHHSHCTHSWKLGSPRSHYPTECICDQWSRSRCSFYFCPCGDIRFCQDIGPWSLLVLALSHTAKGLLISKCCMCGKRPGRGPAQCHQCMESRCFCQSYECVQSPSCNQPPQDSHINYTFLIFLFDFKGPQYKIGCATGTSPPQGKILLSTHHKGIKHNKCSS